VEVTVPVSNKTFLLSRTGGGRLDSLVEELGLRPDQAEGLRCLEAKLGEDWAMLRKIIAHFRESLELFKRKAGEVNQSVILFLQSIDFKQLTQVVLWMNQLLHCEDLSLKAGLQSEVKKEEGS
jgi:hypothetical protein